jgi:hypothetical protein
MVMAKKSPIVNKTAAPAVKAADPSIKSIDVRNSPIPRAVAPAARKQPTYEQIAQRAYEIWQSGTGGSETDNWHRAERELRV